jgi:hypothetical protein
MKKFNLTLICLTLLCIFSNAQNQVTAPKIISTIPDFGDCSVDPNITEIVLKFDQDMGEGYSVPDLTNMPQITGQPRWIDKRTISLPVKLYPNRLYSLVFNTWQFQNFKNVGGIPLNPVELHFQTKVFSCKALNKQSYNDLVKIFPSRYSYASLKGINWATLLEQSKSDLENSQTQIEFGLKLVKLLRNSDDTHLWVEVEGRKYETGKTKIVEPNFNSGQIFSRLQNQYISKGFRNVAGVIDSIGYISFRDWNTDFNNIAFQRGLNATNNFIPALDVLNELLKYPNLIIDVRENSGGNEFFAKEFASLFIKDSVAYEKVKNYNVNSGKFDNELIKWLIPSKNKVNYAGNIYVFSGPAVMSSNESFILMMQQIPNVKVVGMNTYGSSGNPMPYKLSNDVTIWIPSWQAFTLDGEMIEGNGIKPDVEIIIPNENFQNKDALFEKMVWRIKNGK